jgi:hypothetical protein
MTDDWNRRCTTLPTVGVAKDTRLRGAVAEKPGKSAFAGMIGGQPRHVFIVGTDRKGRMEIAMRFITSCLALGTLALLSQGAPAQLPDKKALTLEAARKMVAGAEAEAGRHHLAGVVAVVYDGGWPS